MLACGLSSALARPALGAANVTAFGTDEFVDYAGRDCAAYIVAQGKRRFFAKRLVSRLEVGKSVSAWNLGRGRLNVPAMFAATGTLNEALDRRFGRVDGAAWALVTLCQDYRPAHLPIRDLTKAIASELAFSAWINRRDAHNSNRVYLDGVPMFFDFDAAFAPDAGDPRFLRAGPDPGYTDNWRLLPIEAGHAVQTVTIRQRERDHPLLTLHPVHDVDRFHRQLRRQVAEIRNIPERHIVQCVNRSFADRLDREKLDRLPDRRAAIAAAQARPRRRNPVASARRTRAGSRALVKKSSAPLTAFKSVSVKTHVRGMQAFERRTQTLEFPGFCRRVGRGWAHVQAMESQRLSNDVPGKQCARQALQLRLVEFCHADERE